MNEHVEQQQASTWTCVTTRRTSVFTMLQSQGELTMVSARDFRTDPFSPPPSARLAPSSKSRCFASLRGHLRFQWLHVLFFGIVKPTFSPPAALCALAGRIKEGETVRLWGERRANAKKRARCGHGRAGGAISHMAPRGLPSVHGWQSCSMAAQMCQAARPVGWSRCTQCTDHQGRRAGAFLRLSADIMPCI